MNVLVGPLTPTHENPSQVSAVKIPLIHTMSIYPPCLAATFDLLFGAHRRLSIFFVCLFVCWSFFSCVFSTFFPTVRCTRVRTRSAEADKNTLALASSPPRSFPSCRRSPEWPLEKEKKSGILSSLFIGVIVVLVGREQCIRYFSPQNLLAHCRKNGL